MERDLHSISIVSTVCASINNDNDQRGKKLWKIQLQTSAYKLLWVQTSVNTYSKSISSKVKGINKDFVVPLLPQQPLLVAELDA